CSHAKINCTDHAADRFFVRDRRRDLASQFRLTGAGIPTFGCIGPSPPSCSREVGGGHYFLGMASWRGSNAPLTAELLQIHQREGKKGTDPSVTALMPTPWRSKTFSKRRWPFNRCARASDAESLALRSLAKGDGDLVAFIGARA